MELSYRVTLPEPCSEDWDKMAPEGCGRFCAACEKTVVDFTAFSEEQFINYFQRNGINTCGRFTAHQFSIDIPWLRFDERPKKRISHIIKAVKYAVVSIFSLSATTGKVIAEPAPTVPFYQKTATKENKQHLITGVVLDAQSRPLPAIQVTLKGTEIFTATNDEGCFELPDTAGDRILQITAKGFIPCEKRVDGPVMIILEHDSSKVKVPSPVNNILKAPEGDTPGIVATSGGGPATPEIILGRSRHNRLPLIIIDNEPYRGSLSLIDPKRVKTLKLIAETEATAIYGSKGMNGAVVIITKKSLWQRLVNVFRKK